jgi:hypothetical protein
MLADVSDRKVVRHVTDRPTRDEEGALHDFFKNNLFKINYFYIILIYNIKNNFFKIKKYYFNIFLNKKIILKTTIYTVITLL